MCIRPSLFLILAFLNGKLFEQIFLPEPFVFLSFFVGPPYLPNIVFSNNLYRPYPIFYSSHPCMYQRYSCCPGPLCFLGFCYPLLYDTNLYTSYLSSLNYYQYQTLTEDPWPYQYLTNTNIHSTYFYLWPHSYLLSL